MAPATAPPALPALTDRQAEVLAVITNHIRDHGYPPTVRELAEALGFISANGVKCHLDALVKKGRIQIDKGKARGIRVLAIPAKRKTAKSENLITS